MKPGLWPPPRLVGVDGGATRVRAFAFDPETLETLGPPEEEPYGSTFRPPSVEEQRSGCALSPEELAEGRHRVRVAAQVVKRLAARAPGEPLLVGVAMPGLKDLGRRGITLSRNGPRIPDFVERFLEELPGLAWAPVLGDDGELAGLGEERAPRGSFRGVAQAYYLGAGTGLAEALKLGGQLVELQSWFPRAWQLGFEEGLSAAGLLESYRSASGRPEASFSDLSRASGEAAARSLSQVAQRLSRLVEDRRRRLAQRGVVLERLVLGQRFLGLPALPVEAAFPPGFVVFSELLEAPAVGAAARALDQWRAGALPATGAGSGAPEALGR